MKPFYLLIYLLYLLSTSCSQTTAEQDQETSAIKTAIKEENNQVTTVTTKKGIFYREIISNGKTQAIKQATITFPQAGEIKQVNIKNGDFVKAGQVLALMDNTQASKQLKRTREALLKARVELDDRLIDYGYRLKDSAKVPAPIMQMAKIKSSYNTAIYDYQDAQKALEQTHITAPFSGEVASLEARAFNHSDSFRQFCILLDDHQMLVSFNVLESEYHQLHLGSPVTISPFGEGYKVSGKVTTINPLIDANGMVKITAEVGNANGKLLDGMNVKVTIRNAVPNQLYIPKTAVVQRQDRQVVFVYENGKAKWNYVETGLENSREVCITSGLKTGQMVITSNNFNLAHDADVTLVKHETASE
ncbi:MAG TPA: efflux RND transporter periplasmic adaptor subunit [Pelobium sp.]|nr:efflux RND transporter periplasmic adaptor subunit [Pelobium sp.]